MLLNLDNVLNRKEVNEPPACHDWTKLLTLWDVDEIEPQTQLLEVLKHHKHGEVWAPCLFQNTLSLLQQIDVNHVTSVGVTVYTRPAAAAFSLFYCLVTPIRQG